MSLFVLIASAKGSYTSAKRKADKGHACQVPRKIEKNGDHRPLVSTPEKVSVYNNLIQLVKLA